MSVPSSSDLSVPLAVPLAEVDPVTPAATGHTTFSASFGEREAAPAGPLPAKRLRSRDTILDAAESVAAEDGAAHLTLDAVAERAGVSKGGLLYNFPTKEALLEAMLDRHMHRFEAKQQQAFDALPAGPGRLLKALVVSASGPCPEREKHSGCATLAALANNPRLLEPIRTAHRRRLERLTTMSGDEGWPFERTAAISLAVDGLCLLEILQISPYRPEERQRIIEDLLRLVDETAAVAASRSHV